jgi:hypothetical protein
MKRVYLTLLFLLAISATILAQGDPQGALDSHYATCTGPTKNPNTGKTELTFRVRYRIDNTGGNKVAGFALVYKITGSNITWIDTTVSRVFAGSGVQHFDILTVNKEINPDPSVGPFEISFGAVNFSGGVTGDSLLANIIIAVNDNGTVCIDTAHTIFDVDLNFITELAVGYIPGWSGPYCCPVTFLVPTLTEWGLLIFGALLLGLLIFYLRRYRKPQESLSR